MPIIFPDGGQKYENYAICVNGLNAKKDFSTFITRQIPDLNLLEAGAQCFPRYIYTENGQLHLFDDKEVERHDGITDWILEQFKRRFAQRISKDDIFVYVYGVLHSPAYRRRFADDLKKSLPRLPIVERLADFQAFVQAGRKLADLHLNYEQLPPYPGLKVIQDGENYLVEKMKFAQKGKKDIIIYNSSIRVEQIPAQAYEYVVNGKSGIEWVMERYQVKTDKASGIVNDPNDWAREQGKPRYILDLLCSVINASMQTVEIVRGLPELRFEE